MNTPTLGAKKTNGRILALVFAAIGGGLISFAIANYESLIPYRWEHFATADGAFSMEFPGKPTVEEQQFTLSTGGTRTLTEVGVTTPDRVYYSFTRAEIQNSDGRPIDEILDSGRDGAVKNLQGHLLSEKRIAIQGFPARELQARVRKNMFFDSRLIAENGRLLMLAVVSPGESARQTRNIQRFYDSFRLQVSSEPK